MWMENRTATEADLSALTNIMTRALSEDKMWTVMKGSISSEEELQFQVRAS